MRPVRLYPWSRWSSQAGRGRPARTRRVGLQRPLGCTTLSHDMVEQLVSNLRFAVRALWKARGFTTVAVLSLALGIGANTAIFTLLDQLVLRLLPVKNPERL